MNKYRYIAAIMCLSTILTGCSGFSAKNDVDLTRSDYQELSEGFENFYGQKMLTIEQAKEKYNTEDPLVVNGINYVNTSEAVKLYKNVSIVKIDGDEISDFQKKAYNGVVYLKSGTDITTDDSTDEESLPADFKTAFGFDYKDCENAFDVFCAALKADNIEIDFDSGVFDKQTYALEGVRKYIIDDPEQTQKIGETLMANTEYDKIIETNVNYNMSLDEKDGVVFPDMVSINIKYEKDGNTYSKMISYGSFTTTTEDVMKSLIGSGCGCGPASDCNTGEENGVSCEDNCDMEDPQ